jgi:hypothetical protein
LQRHAVLLTSFAAVDGNHGQALRLLTLDAQKLPARAWGGVGGAKAGASAGNARTLLRQLQLKWMKYHYNL